MKGRRLTRMAPIFVNRTLLWLFAVIGAIRVRHPAGTDSRTPALCPEWRFHGSRLVCISARFPARLDMQSVMNPSLEAERARWGANPAASHSEQAAQFQFCQHTDTQPYSPCILPSPVKAHSAIESPSDKGVYHLPTAKLKALGPQTACA